MGRIDLWQQTSCLPGRAVVGYRTWHGACVRGLIEKQRPMRKGKKIKRGRKGKHLGVLDILSAPQYPSQAWKKPMNGIHNSNKMNMSRVERILDGEWGWEIKCWMDKILGTIPSSPCVREPNVQRQNEFLFVLENAAQMFDARPRVGGGMGVEGDKTNSNYGSLWICLKGLTIHPLGNICHIDVWGQEKTNSFYPVKQTLAVVICLFIQFQPDGVTRAFLHAYIQLKQAYTRGLLFATLQKISLKNIYCLNTDKTPPLSLSFQLEILVQWR